MDVLDCDSAALSLGEALRGIPKTAAKETNLSWNDGTVEWWNDRMAENLLKC